MSDVPSLFEPDTSVELTEDDYEIFAEICHYVNNDRVSTVTISCPLFDDETEIFEITDDSIEGLRGSVDDYPLVRVFLCMNRAVWM